MRCTKSKTPCVPGSAPVAILVHETSVCGGAQTFKREYPDLPAREFKFGSSPPFVNVSKTPGSNESNPTKMLSIICSGCHPAHHGFYVVILQCPHESLKKR